MKIAELHHHFLASAGVVTDTRQPVDKKLFFALKGANFDGNVFAEKAIQEGALWAVVDDAKLPTNNRFIQVRSVLETLQQLATFHRKYLGLPILAITGSNGKTTTKELVSAVLAQRYNVVYTQGNLNNHIGVPLTLLRMQKDTEFGVVEMGANHQREIAGLCEIAQPDYGYITNFGKAHLEGFGGFEGIIKGKSELYDYLRAHHKTAFVNIEDAIAMKQSKGVERITFGMLSTAAYTIHFKPATPFVAIEFKNITAHSQLLGSYNAKNMAAAACIGMYFKVEGEAVKKAIEAYKPDNNRSQIIEKKNHKILLDAYNANPTSMQLAIENFALYKADKKVVILGDMFEVGKTALAEHQHIVDLLEKESFDAVFVCGKMFAQTQTTKVKKYTTFEALKEAVSKTHIPQAMLLIKGSRGMAMERVLEVL